MLTTAQVAKRANIAHNTVRNYAKEYAELVSPDARGENGERRFSDEDVETICTIAALRRSGVPSSEVVARIRNQEVPPVVDVDVAPLQETLQEPSESPQNAPETSYALQVVQSSLQAHLQAHEGRFEALQRQIDVVAAEQRAQLRDTLWWGRLQGAIGGLVLAGFLLLLSWLLVNGAPW